MNSKKPVCFIPYWIKATLDRNKLELASVLDYKTMRQYCSAEDIALLTLLNRSDIVDQYLFSTGTTRSNVNYELTESCFVNWYEQDYLNQICPLHSVLLPTLESRLFDTETLYEVTYPEGYELRDVKDDCIFVIIYPGYFSGIKTEVTEKMVRDLLKLYYAYYRYEELATMRLFKNYIETVNK